jgi:Uma2 family endonuclease
MGSAGYLHERVKANTVEILVGYKLQYPVGMVFSETMFDLEVDEARVPDVSFLLADRLRADRQKEPMEGAPDLAVEIVFSESAAFIEGRSTCTWPRAAVWSGSSIRSTALSGPTTSPGSRAT